MDVLLAGVGGQGTVLASRLIAQAAIDAGTEAKTAETIGMAQRGGCVVSHVRTGCGASSPLIGSGGAELILGFEPGEAVRALDYLRPDGTVVTAKKAIAPVTASLSQSGYGAEAMLDYLRANVKRLVIVDGELIAKQCGTPKVLNIALLGAAIGCGALDIPLSDMEKTISERVPAKLLEQNLQALRLGRELAQKNP